MKGTQAVRNNTGGVASARYVSLMGMLFALAMVLSFLEGMLPVLPAMPPGVKLGLSNIVTMYTLFFLGRRSAYTIAVLKSLFVLMLRGPVGASLSLAGGLLSVTVMLLLMALPQEPSKLILSVCGAVFHNIGQLLMSVAVLKSAFAFAYLPVMILSGVAMGLLTAMLLKLLLPYLSRLDHIFQKRTQ